jgi:hypothetical protein
LNILSSFKRFSTNSGDDLGWDDKSPWSTGLTREHFDGEVVGRQIDTPPPGGDNARPPAFDFSHVKWTAEEEELINRYKGKEEEIIEEYKSVNKEYKELMEGWDDKLNETSDLLSQVREPGARGSYLKDSEKAEMYRLHKEDPEVYTVEKLAKDYRIMRQRVHAILWLKELEEEDEKKYGPLDDSVEYLLDNFPEFFISHDREFHVATLPYKPEFKVMPEGWDGTPKDRDEVHYEISKKEDEQLYQDFLQRLNFNKAKVAKKVKCHKYSRRRPSNGWNITFEKLGARGKRGDGGGYKFVSMADGSTRPLNEFEKMFVKRERPRRRRKILP